MTAPLQPVTPHLAFTEAAKALEFYKAALGAVEVSRMTEPGGTRLMHAEIDLNGMRVFLGDDFPEHRQNYPDDPVLPPIALGGTTVALHLEVPDCDAAVKRAIDAGATMVMPPWDAFWGMRYARVRDPFGHCWAFAHPLPAAG